MSGKVSRAIFVFAIVLVQCKTTGKLAEERKDTRGDRKDEMVSSVDIKGIKGEIVFDDGSTEKFSGYFRGSQENGVLISIRNRLGIEGFRIRFIEDTVFIMNRMEKKVTIIPAEQIIALPLVGEVRFESMSGLLLGCPESIFKDKYKVLIKGNERVKESIKRLELQDAYAEWIEKDKKIRSTYLIYRNRDIDIKIDYIHVKNINGNRVPGKIRIESKGKMKFTAGLEYGDVVINGDVKMDFRVPEGYVKENVEK